MVSSLVLPDVRPALHPTQAGGPRGAAKAIRTWAQMFRDPIGIYSSLRASYGEAVRLPLGRNRAFYLLSHPDHAEHVLVSHQDRYVKAYTYRPLKAFLGDGLLTSEGDTWKTHRRLIQPVFSARQTQSYAADMTAAARACAERWSDGQTLDVSTQMRTLTLDVVGRVLFGTDLTAQAPEIGSALLRLQDAVLITSLLPSGGSPQRTRMMATHLIPGVARSALTIESYVDRMIDERMSATTHTSSAASNDMSGNDDRKYLLDLLIEAGSSGDQPLTRQEIHDEVMTLVLAGFETTANTLTWTLVLLSRFPAARQRLQAEVDSVLGGRSAEASDVDALIWTRAVISETMRLYPPAWTIERDAVVDDNVAGIDIPAGSTVAISPYLLHRNPTFWPNPEGFDPERFLPAQATGRPKYAYIPFGGGKRICIGAGFAQLEAALLLATLMSSHQLDLAPGALVPAKAAVTLHPDGPVVMTVRSRRPAA